MKALYVLILILSTLQLRAWQVLDFEQVDQRIKVYQGQTIHILADSAYVISIVRAERLNEKLQELQVAHEANLQLWQVHQEVLDKVREIERLTAQLSEKMLRDQHAIALNIDEIIAELDRSIAVLKDANAQLQASNDELSWQLAEMELTVKHLRQQIRRIWWQSTADKIVVAVVTFGMGLVVGMAAL
ncbi:hypothetical protein N6H18_14215 [Reichenbachiella agarivorans]|uniref:Uncharacterized protein n=1 Tax=Reichenbachiella agarivorans TaxID=2979464 RepID=A0ABY6CLW5_9BACT|nr:hypothetical protein [Reichenbachiella agarivorans]UXP31503.1 hypothetical protein N6H18_14215 [Reichenbachiella agarivorans]